MFHANDRKLLTEIALPSAMQSIFAGFRTATSGGLMVVLAAEMIGAKAGLGFLITRGQDAFDAVSYTHLDVYKRQRLYCL